MSISRYIPKRINTFDAQKSMIVVDYGCGSGRYTVLFSKKVGIEGKVYAVDSDPKAIKGVEKLVVSMKLANVVPVLANGYDCGLQCDVADRVYAIDMFHGINDATQFLRELCRIAKADGILYIDYGHQPREQALEKIEKTNLCCIIEVHAKHVVCKPK